ncbi:hypothetical protein TKK_0015708 [Trichogramma kaykai]
MASKKKRINKLLFTPNYNERDVSRWTRRRNNQKLEYYNSITSNDVNYDANANANANGANDVSSVDNNEACSVQIMDVEDISIIQCNEQKIDEQEKVGENVLIDNEENNEDSSSSDDECSIDSDDFYLDLDDLNFDLKDNVEKSFIDDERVMFSDSNLTVSDVTMMLKAISIKFNHTREEQIALLSFIRTLAGPTFASWSFTPHLLSKAASPPKETMYKHYYCLNCNIIVKKMMLSDMKNSSIQCEDCEKKIQISSKNSDYFITLDIDYQLKNLFSNKNIQQNLKEFTENSRLRNENSVSDINDLKLYKKLISPEESDVITFNFSTDGAQLFKSAKKALWPLPLHLNCFSGKIRFKHAIIVPLWQTEKEPSANFMNLYMTIFKEECEKLLSTGIEIIDYETGVKYTKKFVPFCCCVDTVARPIIQNRLQFNGFYGCSWCNHAGKYVEKTMRYPLIRGYNPSLRTHEAHKTHIQNVKKFNAFSENGVKGDSILMHLDNFDIVWSLPPDYMHGSLMGVEKQLWNYWISTKQLSKKKQISIKNRMGKIKLCRDLQRSLRSLDFVSKYKALEWKIWLLFVNVPCLQDILPDDLFQSYLLFVDSIYTLLKENITHQEINECEIKLLMFVGQCQEKYEIPFITFNVYSLLHYSESVRMCGPLWATSAFPFESAIYKCNVPWFKAYNKATFQTHALTIKSA